MLTLCNSSLDAAKPNVKAEPPKTRAVAIANAFATTLNRTINNKDPKAISLNIIFGWFPRYIVLNVKFLRFTTFWKYFQIKNFIIR